MLRVDIVDDGLIEKMGESAELEWICKSGVSQN